MVTLDLRSRGNNTFAFLKRRSMDSDRDISDHVFHRTYIHFNPRGKSQRNTLLKIEVGETTFVKYDPTQKK